MKVTREDLYRRVWETPMSRLALEFGVTGNGLAKACRKLNVPYPPRGYWAKTAAGKTPPTPPLPAQDNDTPAATDIRGLPPRPRVSSQAQSEAEAVKKRTNIRVPQRLNRPHPIIAGWLEQHEERKKKAERAVDPFTRQLWRPSPFTELQRRRHRILDSLFKALEKEGAAVREGKSGLFVATINRAEIAFKLREKNRQIKRSNRDTNSDRRPSQGWES